MTGPSSMQRLHPDVQAELAYRDWQRAEAKRQGRRILHRPYCHCSPSWQQWDYVSPGCEVLE